MTSSDFPLKQVAENVWTLRYALPILGHDLGRTVTVIRLASGKLVIHSTAPFTASDIRPFESSGSRGGSSMRRCFTTRLQRRAAALLNASRI